jgi:class 3 adenylate cyclase
MRTQWMRRNAGLIPWLRGAALAAMSWLAMQAIPFYPAGVRPILALGLGALAVFMPSVSVLVSVLVLAVPVAAVDMVTGALLLLIGIGAGYYLGADGGRIFFFIAFAFSLASMDAQWAIAALAGYVITTADGALAAAIVCLVLELAGLLAGTPSIGTVATGGSVGVLSFAHFPASPLSFGWVVPQLKAAHPAGLLHVLGAARQPVLLILQPLAWAGGAAVTSAIRLRLLSRNKLAAGLAGVSAGVGVAAGASAVAVTLLASPITASSMGFGAAAALLVALVTVTVIELVFPRIPVPAEGAPAVAGPEAEADVDELLRRISEAEETLASRHSANATVLITDMKSFSAMTETEGSLTSAKIVQRHRDLLMPVIERNGGAARATGGDGIVAAFSDPAAALAAAVEMQRQLVLNNPGASTGEDITVRIGCASGEVIVDREGRPFIGEALNLAARVMSLADGGQVLVAGELSGSAPAGVPVVSHGAFELKNISQPVTVSEVLWSDGQRPKPPHPA